MTTPGCKARIASTASLGEKERSKGGRERGGRRKGGKKEGREEGREGGKSREGGKWDAT